MIENILPKLIITKNYNNIKTKKNVIKINNKLNLSLTNRITIKNKIKMSIENEKVLSEKQKCNNVVRVICCCSLVVGMLCRVPQYLFSN